MNTRHAMLMGLVAMVPFVSAAQSEVIENDSWRLGIGTGIHSSHMNITKLNSDLYPKSNWQYSGLFSIYVQKSFGPEMNWAIRPQLTFTNRGGNYSDIMKNMMGFYMGEGIENIEYKVSGHYMDLRVPVMYRFGNTSWRIRPYAYVSPILGITTGGHVERDVTLMSGGTSALTDLRISASKANMNPLYFSGAVGVGADYMLNIAGHTCAVGAEVMYEQGLTNTYGHDKRALNRIPLIDNIDVNNPSDSKRRYNGWEFKLTFSIPFSVFSAVRDYPHQNEIVVPEEPIQEKAVEPVVEPEVNVFEELPCYTIEQIDDMINRGESVHGLTICAIDGMITFEFAKSDIDPSSYDFLNKLAKTLIRTNSRVMIKGHTDSIGEDDFNLNLSKQRAISVRNYLEEHGVPHDKLYYSYFGERQPIATNETDEGRRLNRRVEFEIMD